MLHYPYVRKANTMNTEINKNNRSQVKIEVINHNTSILQGIRFGSLEIIVHDGKIVQIERKEKIRFDAK